VLAESKQNMIAVDEFISVKEMTGVEGTPQQFPPIGA
jgi:hypothetical protein